MEFIALNNGIHRFNRTLCNSHHMLQYVIRCAMRRMHHHRCIITNESSFQLAHFAFATNHIECGIG